MSTNGKSASRQLDEAPDVLRRSAGNIRPRLPMLEGEHDATDIFKTAYACVWR